MRLVEKLRRIAAPARENPASARGGAIALPGEAVEGELGRIWMRRVTLPLSHIHGRIRLSELRSSTFSGLEEVARDPRLAGLGLDRAVYFDTETTSLGGGAGTYVFLLGAGYFEADGFVVEQYFLRDVTEERALLHAINRRFAQFSAVVSFYGKGFDAPRLSGRNALHHMRLVLPESHLDLLLVGRSLFRGAFADCRLQTFERELVGFVRQDDFPGADCPQAFFSHLQGDSSLIPKVFEHNLFDVVTLPAVAACFSRAVRDPSHPVLLANLGVIHESHGRDRDAARVYAAALPCLRKLRHVLLPRTLERLAHLERRRGRHAASAKLLLERTALSPHAFGPLEDLAKYYEHRVRDLTRALDTALDARSRLLTGKIEADRQARQRLLRSLDHRLGRLRRRLELG